MSLTHSLHEVHTGLNVIPHDVDTKGIVLGILSMYLYHANIAQVGTPQTVPIQVLPWRIRIFQFWFHFLLHEIAWTTTLIILLL